MDVNDGCDCFTSKLIDMMSRCIPSKEVTIRSNDIPWYDSDIRRLTRKRDRQKKSVTKRGLPSDWEKYKVLRNRVNNLIRFAKQRYFSHLDECLSDSRVNSPQKYWKYLRSLVNSNKTSDKIPILKSFENDREVLHYTDKEKAECLNKYFSPISTVDDSQVFLPQFESKTDSRLDNIEISSNDIESIISTLNVNKAVGPDLISHKLLMNIKSSVARPLSKLFNKSLQERTFPYKWKESIVNPLFKKGDRSLVSNYRPISLLSCVGKLMERCVYKHVYNYLYFNRLLYDKQFGFLKGYSTVHQLLEIYHQVVSSLDSRQNLCMVFCDISKAFDRVWHRGLVFKLNQLGISGPLLSWFKDYLSCRSQSVIANTSRSRSRSLNAGVPQGSVLGPLHFLVYVNDISENLLSISTLFADDTSLACSASFTADIEGILNHDLIIISHWAKQWLVTFNPSKTVAMVFSNNRNVQLPNLIFDDVRISFVDNHKHLGLTLSSNGKWKTHINNLCQSASKLLGMMRTLKFRLKRDSLNQIYVSFLRPVLEYASVVWDNCTKREKENLEKIQIEAARIVTGITRSASLNNIYKEIGWLTLENRRKYQKLILIYKIISGLTHEIFPRNVSTRTIYSLRNIHQIDSIACRTELLARSFIPSAVSLWNELPDDVKSLQSLSSFKSYILGRLSAPVVPKYFFVGQRRLSVIHTRIRNKCSDLKYDLFFNHICSDCACSCGYAIEDAEHYFFQCTRYTIPRRKLFHELRSFHPLNKNLLLFESENLRLEDNSTIFLALQSYIKASERFA